LLAELSRSHELLRYDERGCGLSDWTPHDISFDAWVDDLETVVNAGGVERFVLLGLSQGASIAIAYAVRHPERVSHLILHGSYARGRLTRSNTPDQRAEAETMTRLAELGWGKENPAFRQFFTTQFIPGGSPEQHHWMNELERISTSPSNAARFMRVFDQIDVVDLLSQVRCPTLVLHSTHDVRVPFEEGRLIAGAIAGARFVPLESHNHLIIESEPAWQRMRDEMRAFLPAGVQQSAGHFETLTPRERGLLDLIAQGRDNAQIAANLSLSEKTVRNHITSIFAKLQVENRAQAIVLARDAGFGQPRQ
jgi:pimeloyl-ACP methyl ester carboxylesterase/DNA-binding CsgD family transcriptional regulator